MITDSGFWPRMVIPSCIKKIVVAGIAINQ
jgi:hypothetical protein